MSEVDSTVEPQACHVALVRAFDFLGKRWNGVLLGTLMPGPMGFADLKRSVAGISDSMLSDRLGALTAAKLIDRQVDPGPPISVRYKLTASGHALIPALDALTAWAKENLGDEACGTQET
ncbi:helix-turn-helix domain-containing protein [Streptomyces sp. NPDC094034]|uniref:winged helix-turn-helix transcriptional regulator n=1 Tax=Streptomyces sp. NPDC094034 TaxID=3155309 RepID=UPI00331DE4B6